MSTSSPHGLLFVVLIVIVHVKNSSMLLANSNCQLICVSRNLCCCYARSYFGVHFTNWIYMYILKVTLLRCHLLRCVVIINVCVGDLYSSWNKTILLQRRHWAQCLCTDMISDRRRVLNNYYNLIWTSNKTFKSLVAKLFDWERKEVLKILHFICGIN